MMGLFSRRVVLEIGEAAPDFTLFDQNRKPHALSDYRGRWVVLYFYPRDDTPGCTVEACGFRDAVYTLRDMDVEVLGVSTDSDVSHGKFAEKFGLPFPLLADPGGLAARRYGSLRSLGPLKVAKRHTFLIDAGGRVAKIYREVKPGEHSAQVVGDIRKLRSA